MYWNKEIEFNVLVGKTIKDIQGLEKESSRVCIVTEDGCEYALYHDQGCCETVTLNDYEGDAEDLRGAIVTSAEAVVSAGGDPAPEYPDSWTWTFYKIETSKGGLFMRWLGESNGYYGEEVSFVWTNKPDSD